MSTRNEIHHYENEVVSVAPDMPVWEVADEMDSAGVGCVVVVDPETRPLGIVTDRDLLRRVVAAGRDPEKTPVSEVMTSGLVTADTRDKLQPMLELMKKHAIRRLPIVDEGKLVGIVTLDDVIAELSTQLWNLSEATRRELQETRRTSGKRRRVEHREDALEELSNQLWQLGDQARKRVRQEISGMLERLGGG